jgi:O-methyltransferase
VKRLIKGALRKIGYELVRRQSEPPSGFDNLADLPEEQRRIISLVRPFTLTGVDRLAALVGAVGYLTENGFAGDIAECGVWRGGSMMAIASTLLALGDRTRTLYLYDTFEGMSPPTEQDKNLAGVSTHEQLEQHPKGTGVWCYASLDDVRRNVLSTGYPDSKIQFIKGKVEGTIPEILPNPLALLRLDTDWYESTKHELTHLYPLLCPNGILIIDDYGHWQGARQAVDEYFREHSEKVFLHRIDYTGRLLVKRGT